MKRRDFHKLMAAAVAGLLAGGCSGESGGAGPTSAPASPSPGDSAKTPSSPSGSPMACSANGCNGKMDMQKKP